MDSDGTEALLHNNAHLSHWNGENLIVVRNVSKALLGGGNRGTVGILCPKGVSNFQEKREHRSKVFSPFPSGNALQRGARRYFGWTLAAVLRKFVALGLRIGALSSPG